MDDVILMLMCIYTVTSAGRQAVRWSDVLTFNQFPLSPLPLSHSPRVKLSACTRSTGLIRDRINKLEPLIEIKTSVSQLPLTYIETKSLNADIDEINTKVAEYQQNVERIIEHITDENFDQDAINDSFLIIIYKVETLTPDPEPCTHHWLIG